MQTNFPIFQFLLIQQLIASSPSKFLAICPRGIGQWPVLNNHGHKFASKILQNNILQKQSAFAVVHSVHTHAIHQRPIPLCSTGCQQGADTSFAQVLLTQLEFRAVEGTQVKLAWPLMTSRVPVNGGKKLEGRDVGATLRFDLELAPPTDESTNEFSYIYLVKDAERDTKVDRISAFGHGLGLLSGKCIFLNNLGLLF